MEELLPEINLMRRLHIYAPKCTYNILNIQNTTMLLLFSLTSTTIMHKIQKVNSNHLTDLSLLQ